MARIFEILELRVKNFQNLTNPQNGQKVCNFQYFYTKLNGHDAFVPFQIDNYGTSAFQRRVWRLFWASRTISMPI